MFWFWNPTCFCRTLFLSIHLHKNLHSCRAVTAKYLLHLWIAENCLTRWIKTICYSTLDSVKQLHTIGPMSTIVRNNKIVCRQLYKINTCIPKKIINVCAPLEYIHTWTCRPVKLKLHDCTFDRQGQT